MGQYFQLINVDRREALFMGKLREAISIDPCPILQLLLRQESQDDPAIGAWVGHRIITAGDYMTGCPSGMLTEAEQAEVNHFAETTGRDSDGAFYFFASETFKDIPSVLRPLEPKTNDLVLRNLSLHVYVRINDFKRLLDEKMGEVLDHELDSYLHTLIVVNTSWSDDIVPVPWAGDRFDVTLITELESEGDLWKDVTEDQVEGVYEIVEG